MPMNAGDGSADRAEQETHGQLRVSQAELQRNREGGDGVARGEGKLVGRQQGGPALRLERARAPRCLHTRSIAGGGLQARELHNKHALTHFPHFLRGMRMLSVG